jgi:hypothetical protein
VILVAVVAFAFFTLVLFRPGLLRRRMIAAAFAVTGIVAALIANAVTHDSFLVAAACMIPVLVGLLLQEMLDGVTAAASTQRARSRERRAREQVRTPEDRERARRERDRDRDRIAA